MENDSFVYDTVTVWLAVNKMCKRQTDITPGIWLCTHALSQWKWTKHSKWWRRMTCCTPRHLSWKSCWSRCRCPTRPVWWSHRNVHQWFEGKNWYKVEANASIKPWFYLDNILITGATATELIHRCRIHGDLVQNVFRSFVICDRRGKRFFMSGQCLL